MTHTICLGGPLHGKRVHIISHPSETSDMLDESAYSLRVLSRAEGNPQEHRRFYVSDEISDTEAAALAAHHWEGGALSVPEQT